MVPKGTGKNPLERTGGHPLRRWVVHFIRDSEYKISGIKKLVNKYARLDYFLVCPENFVSVQLSLLQSLYFLVQTLQFPLLHRAEALLRRAFL